MGSITVIHPSVMRVTIMLFTRGCCDYSESRSMLGEDSCGEWLFSFAGTGEVGFILGFEMSFCINHFLVSRSRVEDVQRNNPLSHYYFHSTCGEYDFHSSVCDRGC